ncbi:MAG: F0F1 ATP synthase subunit B [Candidatus Saccharimonadales bacterium]
MIDVLSQVAAAETAEHATAGAQADLLGALGISWQSLIIQLASFVILFLLLKKFVFPALFAALDKREKVIAASVDAAADAQKAAEKAQADVRRQLDEAKKQAAVIVETAHTEATQVVEEAEARANKRAEHLVSQAESRLSQDIEKARQDLRKEMLHLVTKATTTVIGEKMTAETDKKLIARAVKEAQ